MRSKRTLKRSATIGRSTKAKSGSRPRRRTSIRVDASAGATRQRLLEAALATLQSNGFPGATARAIARAGGLNQALIFYHFGSLDRLLLAALDLTSSRRLSRYQAALSEVSSLTQLLQVMSRLYAEDVEVGHVAAVQEMVAGGSSVPALRHEVVRRMEPWVGFAEEVISRVVKGTLVQDLLPTRDIAFAAVALYFGIETLTHLDGDRSKAEGLFKAGMQFAPLGDELLRLGSAGGDTA